MFTIKAMTTTSLAGLALTRSVVTHAQRQHRRQCPAWRELDITESDVLRS